MHRARRSWITPVLLLALLMGAAGLADSGTGDAGLPSEQVASAYPDGDASVVTGEKGVRRNCVLLEVFMRPT
jgi:hypothetical protein